MADSSHFRAQAEAWQRYLKQKQSGGWLQRIAVWLIFGLLLAVALTLMVFFILLSWLLIPIMVYRARKKMRAMQQQAEQYYQRQETHIIEGEFVVHDDDNKPRQ